jgi:hypothetical protein
MSDLGLPLNCPYCGVPLVYVEVGVVQSYFCDVHGEFRLGADGALRGGTGEYGRPPTSRERSLTSREGFQPSLRSLLCQKRNRS